ncbi:hypothetical protein ACU4HD_25105 [Cupriavidus basilensis]
MRLDVPRSNGTPTKQASSPVVLPAAGSRIMVAMPPKRGMALPDIGRKGSAAPAGLRSSFAFMAIDSSCRARWHVMVEGSEFLLIVLTRRMRNFLTKH